MLIIYSHPNQDGHAGHYLKTVEKFLQEKKVDYEVLDLYQMKYDPILHQNEHYTSGNKDVSQENQEIQQKIKAHNQFVFIYPTWWNNVPAILKGFLDRVFVSGFGFRFKKSGIPEKLLKGKKAVVFSSSGGPRIYSWLFARDRALKVVANDTLEFCGIKTKTFSVGKATRFTEAQKNKIEKIVPKGMRYLLG